MRALIPMLCLFAAAASGENLHFTYLWHMEQPIYWPDQQLPAPDRYERAWQSIQRTDGGAPHPADNLREIFSKDDRVAAYQWRVRDCVNLIRYAPEAGAQVSYSGGLIENVTSLGAAGQLGYSATWYAPYREARNWSTVGAKPRLDLVIFPFHHGLLPLLDESAVRKEIQLYKLIYADAWGAAPGPSRGLFPSEMAFSRRLIKVLDQEGVDWVVVSNEHLSRACADFPVVLGSGGINCDPPNRADQRNAAQANWLRISISRGVSPVNAYPFAYTPHHARYLDPESGQEHRVIVIPADQALGWDDGYAPLGLSVFNTLQAANPPGRPQLVLLAHDGDNAWGGGFSYYMEAVPNFVAGALNAGYVPTTIEQYLASHPPSPDDVVHVEDGAWVNADGDFGSPLFLNWCWPLLDASGQIDIPGGWHVDARNWAVITAAQNRVDTAEQIAGGVNLSRVLYPSAASTRAELAWHFFLGALNSGFMYYGTALDHEVKPSVACNEAVQHADVVIGDGALDATGPTIFIPLRHPWNPGALNFGPQYGYASFQSDGDFWVYTFAYDVSGVASAVLKYRLDADGLPDDDNQTYAGGAGVGPWQTVPMTYRDFPAGNVYNDPSISFFEMPAYIADQYTALVTGVRDQLVDYYVEAVDGRGNIRRSPIQHVYVGAGGGAPGLRVTFTPDPALAGQPLTIDYDANGGPLDGAAAVFAHIGYDNWQVVLPNDLALTPLGGGLWRLTFTVSATASQLDVAFNDGAGHWDNNNGQDWHVAISGGLPDWVMDGALDATAALVAQNGVMKLYAEYRDGTLYVAGTDAGEGNDHFIFVAETPGALRPAPWAKAGQVAGWSAFLADENGNDYEAWYDAGPGVFTQAATGPNGGVLEGTIDLAAQFGHAPTEVWLALGPYQTQDGGALMPGLQVPASTDGDGTLEAGEYVRVPLSMPGDLDGDGCVGQADLGILLGAFGCTGGNCAGDVNGDGATNQSDLGVLLGNFGLGC